MLLDKYLISVLNATHATAKNAIPKGTDITWKTFSKEILFLATF